MQIEAIESRQLLAAVALDGSFGEGGRASLGETQFGSIILAVTGAVYVEGSGIGYDHAIVRMNDSGKIDLSWGDNGRVLIPFDVVRMAFDKRTGGLVVGGFNSGVNLSDEQRTTLLVSRVDSRGKFDGAFGQAGVARFTPAAGETLDVRERRTANFKCLIPLAHKGVLVGADVGLTQVYDSSDQFGDYISYISRSDVVVAKFTGTGVRDRWFGRRGTVVVASGHAASFTTPFEFSENRDEVFLGDVLPRPDGGFKVVSHREKAGSFYTNEVGRVDVFSSEVDALGQSIAERSSTWNLYDRANEPKKRSVDFTITQLVATAEGSVAVARSQHLKLSAFELQPMKRPVVREIPAGNWGNDFVLSLGRRWQFAIGSANVTGGGQQVFITRFRRTFVVDRVWKLGGLASERPLNASEYNYATLDGKLLHVDGSEILRFSV